MKDIVNSRGAKVIRAKGFAFIPTLKGRVFPLRPSQSREIKDAKNNRYRFSYP